METVSKTCPVKIGQYCLVLCSSPQAEAYEHLFGGLLLFRPKEKPREPYQPIIIWARVPIPIISLFWGNI